MYEKIFPSRISEVKEYLSQRILSIDRESKKHPENVEQHRSSHMEFIYLGEND